MPARSFLRAYFPQSNVIHYNFGAHLSHDSFESAIKHMYGFEFKGVGKPRHLLIDLAEVALIAQLLGITGLREQVSEIANRAMTECVNNEVKMKNFLYIGRHDTKFLYASEHIFNTLAVEILGKCFFEIYDMEVVRYTFNRVPTLMSDLLQYLGDSHHSEEDEEVDEEDEEEESH